MKSTFFLLVLTVAAAGALAMPADAQRQADVARRGRDVMPFSLAATQHVFTKTAEGGTQRVVARDPRNAAQVKLVRQHLREIHEQFQRRDFSGPARIHGEDMPGLAELNAAKAGELAISYKDVRGGAELAYRTGNPVLVAAVHSWFDAQLSDHGHDAMAGQERHRGGMQSMQGTRTR